jgi:hypothetical protein
MSYYYNYENTNANVENTNTNTNTNTNATTNTTSNATNTTANATTTNTNTNTKTNAKPRIYEDFLIFGNFFGLVPEAYVKYFNLFAIQICCTLIFAGIYYALLCNFDKYFFIQEGFPKKQFLDNKLGIALIMSINFQTTTAYVDIKCKTFLARSLFSLQIVCAFAIAFLFFL